MATFTTKIGRQITYDCPKIQILNHHMQLHEVDRDTALMHLNAFAQIEKGSIQCIDGVADPAYISKFVAAVRSIAAEQQEG